MTPLTLTAITAPAILAASFLDAQFLNASFTFVGTTEIIPLVRREWKEKKGGHTNGTVNRERPQIVGWLANVKGKDIDSKGELNKAPGGERTKGFFETFAFGASYMGLPFMVEPWMFRNPRPKLESKKIPKAGGSPEEKVTIFEIGYRENEEALTSLWNRNDWPVELVDAETIEKFPITPLLVITFEVKNAFTVLLETADIYARIVSHVSDIARNYIGCSTIDQINRGLCVYTDPVTGAKLEKKLVEVLQKELDDVNKSQDYLGLIAVKVSFRQWSFSGPKAGDILQALLGPQLAELQTKISEQEAKQKLVVGEAEATVIGKKALAEAQGAVARMKAFMESPQLGATVAIADGIGNFKGPGSLILGQNILPTIGIGTPTPAPVPTTSTP